MKVLIAMSLMGLSFGVAAKDSKIDYKYCQEAFNVPEGFGQVNGFPFKLGDDGKVTPHKDVKYKYDDKKKIETMTYKPKMGFGQDNPHEVIIKRDKNGAISQVIYNSEFKGIKTKSGLGSKQPAFGMGMPGIGIGYPGVDGGFGGYGGMNTGPSKSSSVFDVKIKAGKCFPYRSVGIMETGSHTHQTFSSDVQMCYDIKKHLKEEGTEGSELNKLKECSNKYSKASQKIIDGHMKRNDDLYNPPSDPDDYQSPWGTGGYFGNMEEGSFGNGEAGGQGGYGYPGGFAGSIDNIAQSQMFTPSQKVKMLSQYCAFPYGAMKEMLKDKDLFKKEIVAAGEVGGEGSGGGAKGNDK